ncbi:MAG: hypothetical protein LUD47_07895 [Clostridia bacterium]|nr:hypothetical protein [Clostridia bacterium]
MKDVECRVGDKVAHWTETDVTRRQVNVIYAKVKAGELRAEKWVLNQMYKVADWCDYGRVDMYTFDRVRNAENEIRKVLGAIFGGKKREAQVMLDNLADEWHNY